MQCVGGAFIYSGRPNPTWHIDKSTVGKLEDLWNLMELFHGVLPKSPPLGYSGCFMKCDDRKWFAYSNVVTLKKNNKSESRIDKDRKFEKLLFNSAPIGILPNSFIIE